MVPHGDEHEMGNGTGGPLYDAAPVNSHSVERRSVLLADRRRWRRDAP